MARGSAPRWLTRQSWGSLANLRRVPGQRRYYNPARPTEGTVSTYQRRRYVAGLSAEDRARLRERSRAIAANAARGRYQIWRQFILKELSEGRDGTSPRGRQAFAVLYERLQVLRYQMNALPFTDPERRQVIDELTTVLVQLGLRKGTETETWTPGTSPKAGQYASTVVAPFLRSKIR